VLGLCGVCAAAAASAGWFSSTGRSDRARARLAATRSETEPSGHAPADRAIRPLPAGGFHTPPCASMLGHAMMLPVEIAHNTPGPYTAGRGCGIAPIYSPGRCACTCRPWKLPMDITQRIPVGKCAQARRAGPGIPVRPEIPGEMVATVGPRAGHGMAGLGPVLPCPQSYMYYIYKYILYILYTYTIYPIYIYGWSRTRSPLPPMPGSLMSG
jgi:hypothetical protein